MKRVSLAFSVGVLVLAAQFANADAFERRLVILNRTKADLLELYTSPVVAKNWGADQLGSLRIGAGGEVTVNLHPPDGGCEYDLMLVFADGERLIRRTDVCVASTLIVTEHVEPVLPFI